MSGHQHNYEPSPLAPNMQICKNARYGCDAKERMTPLRPAPAQEHSETSKEAARAIDGKQRHRDRLMVYGAFQAAGSHGLTDEELYTVVPLGQNTARPRRIDLVNENLVVDSKRKRPTRSGRTASVWVLASELQVELPQEVVPGEPAATRKVVHIPLHERPS